jgi:hypothetical protein
MTMPPKQQPDTVHAGHLVLDLAGAKALMKARRKLAREGAEVPPMDISMYKAMAYTALDYLGRQVGQFEVCQAMFADQPMGILPNTDQASTPPTASIKDSP